METICAAIIAKNEERMLPDCLNSLSWVSEVVLIDDNSRDETVKIAQDRGVRVFSRTLDVEGTQRNFALQQAKSDWILIIDADERVSPELKVEIEEILEEGSANITGYAIPVKSFMGKRWIRGGGYYPATRLRLFRRGCLRYEDASVHPKVFFEGQRAFLKGDIIHYGWRDFAHFISKLNNQTTLEAKKWVEDCRRVTLFNSLRKMADRFFRNYFRKNGWRDGFLGFMMCVFHALYQLFAYTKYWELKESSDGKRYAKSIIH